MTPGAPGVAAIVVAAGEGRRLGRDEPKALVTLAGRTLLEWSLDPLVAAPSIGQIIVACGPAWIDRAAALVAGVAGNRGRVCEGGATRSASVRAALALVADDAGRVVVHDAARPFARAEMVENALAALDRAVGAVCAVPVSDTVKRVAGEMIVATLDRGELWRAQTPQAFRLADLRAAHQALEDGTDDASLLEARGAEVVIVPGDEGNIKITTAADLALAEALAGLR